MLIVGGGPAGMSAALSSYEAGHSVTLVEAGSQLGGQVLLASSLEKRDRFGLLVSELIQKILDSDITLKLNTLISNASECLNDFDSVIVATGANFVARDFGVGIPVITVETAIKEFAQNKSQTNEEIIVIDDQGTWIAASITEQLAANGYKIHLVSPTA